MKICMGHVLGTAVLGALLPSGEHLGWLDRLMLPVVALIPNAVRLTERAPDVVFAQTADSKVKCNTCHRVRSADAKQATQKIPRASARGPCDTGRLGPTGSRRS